MKKFYFPKGIFSSQYLKAMKPANSLPFCARRLEPRIRKISIIDSFKCKTTCFSNYQAGKIRKSTGTNMKTLIFAAKAKVFRDL
jgi:uncharacterized protein VirK/YbjX